MTNKQRFRQIMSETGLEKTPEELDDMISKFCPPLNLYKKFLAMDNKDIRAMAKECGDTYQSAKETVDMALFLGHMKWGIL